MSDPLVDQPLEPSATAPGIGLERVVPFLEERFGSDEASVVPLRGGAWSNAFGFQVGSNSHVIRFSHHVEDFERDLRAFRYVTPDLPIPKVTQIGEAFGSHYAISRRMFGRSIDEVDGQEMRLLLPSLFAMLDALRLSDLSGSSGFGSWSASGDASFGSWGATLLDIANDRAADRGHGWRQVLEDSALGMAAYHEGYARLQAHIEFAPRERFLVHSDLLNNNTLVEPGRISGVLDWGCSMYGDFLYDLAWFVFWSPWYPRWAGIDFLAEGDRHYGAIGLDIPNFGERMRICLLHIGLAHISYNAWLRKLDVAEAVADRTLLLSDRE